MTTNDDEIIRNHVKLNEVSPRDVEVIELMLKEARFDTLIRVKHELEAIADIGHEQPHVLPAFKADAGKKWLGFTKDDWDKFWKENKEVD